MANIKLRFLHLLQVQLVVLLLVAIVPVFGLLLSSTQQQKELRQVQVKNNLMQQARLMAAYQEQKYEGARQLLLALSITPQVRQGDAKTCSDFLAKIMEQNTDYALIAVADLNGDVICSALPFEQPVNIGDRAYFQRVLQYHRVSVGDFQVGRISGRPSIGMGYPIYSPTGRTQAILFATLDLESFGQLADQANLAESNNTHLTVLDQEGIILHHQPEAGWEGKSIADLAVFQIMQSGSVEGNFEATCLDDSRTCLYTFRRLEPFPFGGYILTGTPERAAFASIDNTFRFQLAGLLIVLLVAALISWSWGNFMVIQRIQIINRAMALMKQGDLRARTGIPPDPGEMSQLASSFDRMADSLEQREMDLRRAEAARAADASLRQKMMQDLQESLTERQEAETKVEQQIKQLATLRAIDMAILGLLDLQPILTTLVDQVIRQLQVHAAAILLFQANILEYAAGDGFNTRARSRIQVALGEGLIGQAALEGKFKFCEDAGGEYATGEGACEKLNVPILMAENFVAYAAVPLITKSELKGVLCVFHRSPMKMDEAWRSFLEALAGQAAIAIENANLYQQTRRSNLELMMAYEETIEGWANALELRDQETEGHSRRVVDWTLKMARAMGIPDEEIVHVRRGAILHDIGKMGIPDSILLKNGPLNPEEWVKMRQHPVYAYGLLSAIPFLRPALDIPYRHHEHWDGGGYPEGLKGYAIPLSARIFAVIDVWDALRNDRPYHARWPEDEVREYLRQQAGKLFDPQVVEMFLRLLEKG
jgi:HD-GYP domain-containing protein (c-di-GMP phosphodiesterase class II)